MEIQLYIQILRRDWWVIALTTFTALTTAMVISYFSTPQYETKASFIITPSSALVSRNDILNTIDTLGNQSVTTTYSEIMTSGRIYNDALAAMKLQPSDMEGYTYETEVVANSSILVLKVKGENPQLAANFANAIGYQTISFTRQFYNVFNVNFLDPATVPVVPDSPKPALYAALSVVLGILIGVVLVIVLEQLRLPLEAFRQRLHYDQNTGVFNNKYFLQMLNNEMGQNPDTVLSIGIIELNGVRDLDETLPIVSLQRILKKVTDILQRELRGNDVIGRWDDNSFVIMLPNTPGMAAKSIFDRIFRALSKRVELDELNSVIELDPRIGGAEFSSDISTQELLEKVGMALEQARRYYANRVCVWELNNPFWTQPVNDKREP